MPPKRAREPPPPSLPFSSKKPRMHPSPIHKRTPNTLTSTPPKLIFLPSLELAYEGLISPQKIWARHVFKDSEQMEYAVATEDEFWAMCSKSRKKEQKYYEILAQGSPCFGYWDLEADLLLNPNLNKDLLVVSLIAHIRAVFEEIYNNAAVLTPEDFFILDFSSPNMMKVRLIAKPHSGNVMAAWIDNCYTFEAFAQLVNNHIAHSADAHLFQVRKGGTQTGNLINMDLCTHDSALKLFHSPKTERDTFMESLVCHVPNDAIMLECNSPDDTGDLPIEVVEAIRAEIPPSASSHYFPGPQLLQFSTGANSMSISLRSRDCLQLVHNWTIEKERLRLQTLFNGYILDYPTQLAENGFHLAPVNPQAFNFTDKSTNVWISAKGSGKTNLIRNLISKEAVGNECIVLAISSHRSMAKFLTSEYGLDCYLDLKAEGWKAIACASRLVISEESLRLRTQTNRVPPDILVLDEIETLLRHFLSDTMDGKREQAFCDLEYLVESARTVLVADADFGERGWWFLSRLRSQIVVHCSPPQSNKEFHWVPKKEHFEALVRLHAHKRHTMAVVSNSLTEAEHVERIIRSEDSDSPLLLISSITQSDSNVEQFLGNPRTEATKYKYLIYTPTIGPGVDISTPVTHFDHIMAYATPQSSCAADFLQQVGRIRSSRSHVIPIFVAPRESALQVDADVLFDLVASRDDSVMEYGVDGISKMQWNADTQTVQCRAMNESYARLWAYNIAEKHRSQHNFMGELYLLLWRANVPFRMWNPANEGVSEGEFVRFVDKNSREKEARKAAECEKQRGLFRETRVLTEEEKVELELQRENGGDLEDEDELALDKYFVMRFWGLSQSDFETMADEELDYYMNEENRDRQRAFEQVVSGEASRVFNDVLGFLGIEAFDDSTTIYTRETINVKSVASKLLYRKKKIQEVFPHEDFTQKYETLKRCRDLRSVNIILSTLLESCGLRLNRRDKSVRRGGNPGKITEYSIDSESVEKAKERTIRRLSARLKRTTNVAVQQWIRGVLGQCGVYSVGD